MSYIYKSNYSQNLKSSINFNLISAIVSSISDENTLYSPDNFKDILKLMTLEDLESFKKNSFPQKTGYGTLLLNIAQFALVNSSEYIQEIELTVDTYKKIKQSLYDNDFEYTISQFITISNHNEKLVQNTQKIKRLFQFFSDIEEMLSIDISDTIIKDVEYVILPFAMEEHGFKKREYSIAKKIDIFSAISFKSKNIPIDINIFGKNISNCQNILILSNSKMYVHSSLLSKTPGVYDTLYSNIILELEEIKKHLKNSDLDWFNLSLTKSDMFNHIMDNYQYPSPGSVYDFKKKFNELNPEYFITQLTKSDDKGFKIYNKTLKQSHDIYSVLNYYSTLLLNSKTINKTEEVLDKLFFTYKADKESATKNIEKNNKSNNNLLVNNDFFCSIKNWSEQQGFSFDQDYKFLTTILNSGNYKNLTYYLNAISNNNEQLGLALQFIQDGFNGKKQYTFNMEHKKVSHEHFLASLSEYILSQTIPLKEDKLPTKLLKF